MKRHLLKLACMIAAFVIIFTFSACDIKNNTQTASKSLSECVTWIADKKVENDKYTVDVKIPQINFDKPGANSINEEIKAKFYTNDVVTSLNGGFEGVQLYIKTDLSLNGNILSVKIKQELYPSYGTDGEVYSVLYDIKNDVIITPSKYIKDKGYVYDKVIKDTKAAFEKQTQEHIEYFDIAGIHINEQGQMEVIAVILVHPVKADSWKVIFYYTYK